MKGHPRLVMSNSRRTTGAGIGMFLAIVGLREFAIYHFSDMELILIFTTGFLGLLLWLKIARKGIFAIDEEE
jgi:xanthine/uracil/vitamin C permease (AzgA family)